MKAVDHTSSGERIGGGLRDAAWLARMDIRRSWVSFPVAALIALIPGIYRIFLYSTVFSGSMGSFGTFLLDGGLTMTLIQAAKTQGPLAAGLSVAFGCAALILWILASGKRLGKRELG